MNSADFTVFELFETDRLEAASEIRDLEDGDLGIGLGFVMLPSSVARCFFVGELLLLKVNVLLVGRSRFVPSALLACNIKFSSCAESFLDLIDFAGPCLMALLPSLSPIDGMEVVDTRGVSSLCVRTKSALTSIFSVRIAARWCVGMFRDSCHGLATANSVPLVNSPKLPQTQHPLLWDQAWWAVLAQCLLALPYR